MSVLCDKNNKPYETLNKEYLTASGNTPFIYNDIFGSYFLSDLTKFVAQYKKLSQSNIIKSDTDKERLAKIASKPANEMTQSEINELFNSINEDKIEQIGKIDLTTPIQILIAMLATTKAEKGEDYSNIFALRAELPPQWFFDTPLLMSAIALFVGKKN